MIRHKVKAALVLATADNKVHYVYQDGIVPLGVDQARLDQWVAQGLVEEVEVGDGATTEDVLHNALAQAGLTREQALALLSGQNPPAGDETGDGQVTAADTDQLPADAPKKSASKADWVEYAVGKGMDRAEAEKATKEDLITAFAAQG